MLILCKQKHDFQVQMQHTEFDRQKKGSRLCSFKYVLTANNRRGNDFFFNRGGSKSKIKFYHVT